MRSFSENPATIAVLDLQGGVEEHLDHLYRVGVEARAVKRVSEFESLAGLIIPGGESTCLARLLDIFHLKEAIVREFQRGLKLWGTCAGAILLARENRGDRAHLGLIDVSIARNAFGAQTESFICQARVPKVATETLPLTFIRAPKITSVGAGVDVLLTIDDYIAAAEDERVLVTVFHPELTPSLAFHRYFAKKCGLVAGHDQGDERLETAWTPTSWMQAANSP